MTDEIDQDVREAASGLEEFAYIGGPSWVDAVLAGKADHDEIVQAFARMKAAGRQQGLRGIMARRYVGSRNLYYLTPNGLCVRDVLRAIASQEGK